jgi:ASC-1-like (ASCH) protein
MKQLFLKQKYLRYILEGKKPLEGRVGYDNIKKAQTWRLHLSKW